MKLKVLFLVILGTSILNLTLASPEEHHQDCPEECSLPPEGGPCLGRKRFRMWYFNSESGECGKFSYGGCRGNKNKFWSWDECSSLCGACRGRGSSSGKKQEEEILCQLPLDQGAHCENSEVKPSISWFFNSTVGTMGSCEPFAFIGCGGNDNKFETHQLCEAACGAHDNKN